MKNQGFTLVEVIVVAVIVAILALFAVQMYIGYVNDSRELVLENTAAAAAGFLNSAENLDATVPSSLIPATLTSSSSWKVFVYGGDSVTFTPPEGVVLVVTGDLVRAHKNSDTSSVFRFR